jgi:hypothetical protein
MRCARRLRELIQLFPATRVVAAAMAMISVPLPSLVGPTARPLLPAGNTVVQKAFVQSQWAFAVKRRYRHAQRLPERNPLLNSGGRSGTADTSPGIPATASPSSESTSLHSTPPASPGVAAHARPARARTAMAAPNNPTEEQRDKPSLVIYETSSGTDSHILHFKVEPRNGQTVRYHG